MFKNSIKLRCCKFLGGALILGLLVACGGNTDRQQSVNVKGGETKTGKTAELVKGVYVGGNDLPSGKYVLSWDAGSESGIISVVKRSEGESEGNDRDLYEFVEQSGDCYAYVSLDDGEELNIPFDAELTIVDYMAESVKSSEILYTGLYECGKDLPEGRYIVSTLKSNKDEYNGIIKFDDVKDETKYIYDAIESNDNKTFYISMKTGRQLYLPFPFIVEQVLNEVQKEDGCYQLYAGQYWIGDDIPAGSYILTPNEKNDDSGIIKVNNPSDEKSNIVYEFMDSKDSNSIRFTVNDGDIINIPFNCKLEDSKVEFK